MDDSRPGIVSTFKDGDDTFSLINEYVKTKFPKIKIIYGGGNTHVMLDHGRHHNFNVDYVVRGMGEGMILDIVECIKKNKDPIYSKTVGAPHYDPKTFMYDISYDMKGDMFDFRHSTHIWEHYDGVTNNESLPIEVSRGCIFKCAFCTYPLLGKNKNDLSYMRHEDCILEEVLYNYENFGTTSYIIIDDTFNHRTDNIERMLYVRDKSKIDLKFMGCCRLDLLAAKPEQMYMLRDLNFNGYFFGLESLHAPAAKAIGKGGSPEKNIETLYKLRDIYEESDTALGISAGYIIGLPGETPEIAEKNIELLSDEDFPMDALSLSCLSIGPGQYDDSSILKNPKKYGYELLGSSGLYHNWKNDIWDRKAAFEFMCNQYSQIYNSGRRKLDPYQAAGLTRLGYDSYEMMKTSLKKVDESEEIKRRSAEYADNYFINLWKYLNK
jgi:radical SAM superfamily enzyme YgiQ (UPF0313 family)